MYESKICRTLAELVHMGLTFDEELRFKVVSSSMLPLIHPNDEIIVKPLPLDEVGFSDIVVYSKSNEFYVHRLVLKKKCSKMQYFITKADCGFALEEKLKESNLIGKVIAIHRQNHTIDLQLWRERIKGFITAIVSTYVGLIYEILRRIKKQFEART